MRLIYDLIIILLFLTSCNNDKNVFNKIDVSDNDSNERIIERIYYAPNTLGEGRVANEISKKNGIVDGICKTFDVKGRLKKIAYIENGHGWLRVFYDSGKVLLEGEAIVRQHFGNDAIMKNGRIIEYYESGEIRWISNYKYDYPHGNCKCFYKNGKIMYDEYYKNGTLDSICKYHKEDGEIEKIVKYKKGKLVEVIQ